MLLLLLLLLLLLFKSCAADGGKESARLKAIEKQQRRMEKEKDENAYFLKKYQNECMILRRGVDADVNKVLPVSHFVLCQSPYFTRRRCWMCRH